ncbi:hypothetical protein D9M69_635870 [compost metagenome]
MVAFGEHLFDGELDALRGIGQRRIGMLVAQPAQHERAGKNGGERAGGVLPGDVGSRAVGALEQAMRVAQFRRCR